MQQNANTIKEMGVIAEKAYSNYLPGYILENDELKSTYTVVETQGSLLGPVVNLTGFQAMLLKDNSTGQYVIAFRGTELRPVSYQSFADLATDASMAFANFTMQMQLALVFVNEALNKYGNSGLSLSNLTFTGHSLGGSLAEIAGYTFGSETYAYNPFGVKTTLIMSPYRYYGTLFSLGITSAKSTSNITNVVNVGGNYSDPITGVGSHLLNSYLGNIVYVKDRDGGNSLGLAPHGMGDLNESITVYNTLIEIFPDQDYSSLTALIDLISSKDKQVPRLLTSLGNSGDRIPGTQYLIAVLPNELSPVPPGIYR